MYVKPLGDGITQCGVPSHFYADDTQLQQAFNTHVHSTCVAAVTTLERVIEKTRCWMTINKLKLNEEKTEVLTLSSRYQAPVIPVTLRIGNAVVQSSSKVRDLGITLDNKMTMEDHVHNVCRSAYAQLASISHIHRHLTPEATKSLMHALVTSRLDYCNTLLYGLPKVLLNKLQRVQNVCARIVTRTPRHERITPVLKELHWLPVEQRIYFKVLMHTYRSIHGHAPAYL